MPRVSVHCITYQQEDYVGEAIDGALAQDFDDWELVIADDGSSDRTLEIAREYEDRHPQRIRVLSQDNQNDTGKRNYLRALAECRGEFIAGLDGDDLWTSPEKLRRQVELMESRPEVSACFHDMTLLRDSTAQGSIGPASLREYYAHDLIKGVHLSRSSALFRSGLVETFPDGYLDPGCRTAMCCIFCRGRVAVPSSICRRFSVPIGCTEQASGPVTARRSRSRST